MQAIGERGTAQPLHLNRVQKMMQRILKKIQTEKTTPPILKPDNPKPTATKINENKSVVKTEPKPDPPPLLHQNQKRF